MLGLGDTHLPANREDGDLTGMSSSFGDLGGTELWQHLRPLLATAGARGWTLHGVEVVLVLAGKGKLRQEVQPGKEVGETPSVWGWSHHGGGPWCSLWGRGWLTYSRECSLVVASPVGCDAPSAAPPVPGHFLWVGEDQGGVMGIQSISSPPETPPDLSSQ